MASEQSPLLGSEETAEADHNLIYSRFSPRRKHTIVALVAWAGFIPCATILLPVRGLSTWGRLTARRHDFFLFSTRVT